MKMKKLIAMLLSAAMIFSLVACGGGDKPAANAPSAGTASSAPADVETEIWVTGMGANLVNGEHPFYQALVYFDEELRAKTNNKYGLEIYTGAQLGSDNEMVDAVVNGTYKFLAVTSGAVATIEDTLNIFDFPYLFESNEHAYKVLDGEIGQEILANLEDNGLVGLGYGESGFRNLSGNVAYKTPADLAGVKVRTMDIPMHIETFNALGANGTPVAWTETFTGLQQGVIDCQENLNVALLASNIYEVQSHVMLTEHLYAPILYFMNKDYFDGLPAEDQAAIREAAAASIARQRVEAQRQNENALIGAEEHGMTIVRDIDKDLWIEGVQPLYDEYGDKYGEYIERIKAMAD